MSTSSLVPREEREIALLEEMQGQRKPIKTGELVKRAISRFPDRLTPSELQKRTPSGFPWWSGRFRFDLDALRKKGEAMRPTKGYWEITSPGVQRLNAQPSQEQHAGLTKSELKLLDWTKEVMDAIETGEIPAIVRTQKGGFTVELGKHIKETQIVVGRKTSEIKLVIDGEEVILQRNGKSRRGTYEKWNEPRTYAGPGLGETPLIVTVYRKPGWKPSDGVA